MKRILIALVLSAFPVFLFSQEIEYSWDTIDFESPYEYLTTYDFVDNLWEIGPPEDFIFDAPFSGSNAIVTDLDANYPINSYSYFDLEISEFNNPDFPMSFYLEFHHKYDTEEGKDGAYIDISRDGGNSWFNILDDEEACYSPIDEYRTENLYSKTDLLFNGLPGFSGKSGGWISTKFGWTYCVTKSQAAYNDTVIIRFNFISDDIEEAKEGWMIDDIRIYSMNVLGDVNESKPDLLKIYPNPAEDHVSLINQSNLDVHSISVFSMNGELIYTVLDDSEIPVASLPPGIYILRIKFDNNVSLKKLIVK